MRGKPFAIIFAMFIMVISMGAIDLIPHAEADSLPVLLGLYPYGGEDPTWSDLVDEMNDMDAWLQANGASDGISIAATFSNIENQNPTFNVPTQLETYWDGGYVSFVNLSTTRTVFEVANGVVDDEIRAWADAFKSWTKYPGGRMAFIAPLQEMNGDWVSYYGDSDNYKLAYKRIQQIFQDQGVPENSVSWVFAPNGWSNPAKPEDEFENYYPGDAIVDVVAFSAYNYGYCPAQWGRWNTFDLAFKPYLDRMRVMAPGKPIFVAQTGTVKRGPSGDDEALKDQWLVETFADLASYPGVRAILYFNKYFSDPADPVNLALPNCVPVDFRIFFGGSQGSQGVIDVMKTAAYDDWATDSPNWGTYAFPNTRPSGYFADVWPSHPFSDQPNIYYYDYVTALKDSGITGGCGTDSLIDLPIYCPRNAVNRAQMAIFLEKGMRGSGYGPPSASGTLFDDVPVDHWAAAWIEQLAVDGITVGCSLSPPLYCPESTVTRAQMAIFLERAKHWPASFMPPLASGTMFDDVPTSHWAAAWIEQLANDGITGGCSASPPLYCPENDVIRGDMAIFLVRAFNLPMP